MFMISWTLQHGIAFGLLRVHKSRHRSPVASRLKARKLDRTTGFILQPYFPNRNQLFEDVRSLEGLEDLKIFEELLVGSLESQVWGANFSPCDQ